MARARAWRITPRRNGKLRVRPHRYAAFVKNCEKRGRARASPCQRGATRHASARPARTNNRREH
eukprot:5830988-Lingulodinium_polyedra.AAC.1